MKSQANMIFSNFDDVAISELRKKVLLFAEEGIKNVLPSQFMRRSIKMSDHTLIINNKSFSIKNKRIFVIGAGKASAAMAEELEKIIGCDNITDGIVLSNDLSACTQKIKIYPSDHPIPTSRSVDGAKKILEMKDKHDISEQDLIISLISGGCSSLISYPVDGVSLQDKVKMTEALIRSGANTAEMTTLKKKISKIKGGKLAQYFKPARIISLVLSDNINNDLGVIASGPMTKDTTTFADALSIIQKFNIQADIPPTILSFLEQNKGQDKNEYIFNHVNEFIISDNASALWRIKDLATRDNIKIVMQTRVQGEAKEVAEKFCENIFNQEINEATLFLFGGETTVTLSKSHGQGGRNQEFTLACLNYLQGKRINNKWCIASISTDGIDYIKESSGGIVDNNSLEIAFQKKINLEDFLNRHDSYNLLKQINSNIYVGRPTGTNVCDLMMFYVKP